MREAHAMTRMGAWDSKESRLMRRGSQDISSSASFAFLLPYFGRSSVLKCLGT